MKSKSIESRAKTKRIKTNIQRHILEAIALSGGLALAIAVPNMAKVIRPYINATLRGAQEKQRIERSFRSLLRSGHITIDSTDKGKVVRITQKGKLKLGDVFVLGSRNKPSQWDKRWRIVIYDIKEHRRGTRIKVAYLLEQFGFRKIQASVWAYPYPCEELINLLKAELKIGKDLLYAVVEELEYDKPIKEYFDLS